MENYNEIEYNNFIILDLNLDEKSRKNSVFNFKRININYGSLVDYGFLWLLNNY